MSTRILVVEDDAQNSYLIGFILEKSGYEVVAAVDGEQAVGGRRGGSPRPDPHGHAAAEDERLRGHREPSRRGPDTEDVPIIALTAYSMKGDREKILEAGCDGYISKPIDPETFVSQMEEFLPPRERIGDAANARPHGLRSVHDHARAGRRRRRVRALPARVLAQGLGLRGRRGPDGEEALRKARLTPVDVVVTDILMPNMDGYQLCREWKSDPGPVTRPAHLLLRHVHRSRGQALRRGPRRRRVPDQAAGARRAPGHDRRGRAPSTPTAPGASRVVREENEVLREYNERLVAKLEQKLVELNAANAGLTQALEVLSDEIEVKKTLIEQLTADVADARADAGGARREQRDAPQGHRRPPRSRSSRSISTGACACGTRAPSGCSAGPRKETVGEVYPPAVGRTEEFDQTYAPILRRRGGDAWRSRPCASAQGRLVRRAARLRRRPAWCRRRRPRAAVRCSSTSPTSATSRW